MFSHWIKVHVEGDWVAWGDIEEFPGLRSNWDGRQDAKKSRLRVALNQIALSRLWQCGMHASSDSNTRKEIKAKCEKEIGTGRVQCSASAAGTIYQQSWHFVGGWELSKCALVSIKTICHRGSFVGLSGLNVLCYFWWFVRGVVPMTPIGSQIKTQITVDMDIEHSPHKCCCCHHHGWHQYWVSTIQFY